MNIMEVVSFWAEIRNLTFRMQAKSGNSRGNKRGLSGYQKQHEVTLPAVSLKATCIEKQRCVFAQSRNFIARF